MVETGKSEEIEEVNVDEFSLTERSTEAVETENGKSEEVEDTNIRENEEPSNTGRYKIDPVVLIMTEM